MFINFWKNNIFLWFWNNWQSKKALFENIRPLKILNCDFINALVQKWNVNGVCIIDSAQASRRYIVHWTRNVDYFLTSRKLKQYQSWKNQTPYLLNIMIIMVMCYLNNYSLMQSVNYVVALHIGKKPKS